MPDALMSHTTVAAGQLLRRAVAWWLHELADLAPQSMRRRFGRAAEDRAILDFTGGRVFLLLRQPGRPTPVAVQVGDTPDEDRRRVGALLRRHAMGSAVTLRLDPAQLFITTIDLPRAAERSLDAVLRHQIERILPIPAQDIVIGRRILPRSSQATTIKVAVAVCRQATMTQVLVTASDLGLTARQIVANVDEAGPTPVALWQAETARQATPSRRRLYRTLELTAAALLLATYTVHVHRLNQLRDHLQDAVAQAKQQAVAARDLGQRVAQSADALDFLHARRQQPTALFVLDRLTALLPLDTWVSDFSMRGQSVEIIGAAPHATNLIALIEGSGVFRQPQFRSPITLLPDGKAERFDLTFNVVPGNVMPGKPH
jgi:general secretion pathway protein L